MARDAESDLRELITARRAELELRAEKLSQQLQEVRDELEEPFVSERVARRLAEQLHAETEREATPPAAAGQPRSHTPTDPSPEPGGVTDPGLATAGR